MILRCKTELELHLVETYVVRELKRSLPSFCLKVTKKR